MTDPSEHIIAIRKLVSTAEAQYTLELYDQARATFREMTRLTKMGEMDCWRLERDRIELRYKQAGHEVVVDEVSGATSLEVR